jgi:hypothetical protein
MLKNTRPGLPALPAQRTLSTLSGTKLEDVKAATRSAWYQLYLVGGRDVAIAAIERARAAGYAALVVTIDTGRRHARTRRMHRDEALVDGRIGPMLPFLPQFVVKPGWLAGFLGDGGLMNFPNIVLADKRAMPYRMWARRSPNQSSRGQTSSGSTTFGKARSSSRACTPPTMDGERRMKAHG